MYIYAFHSPYYICKVKCRLNTCGSYICWYRITEYIMLLYNTCKILSYNMKDAMLNP
uniref:Uncharacterized protein n=1 Tax=Arundo donax TaxID=35708 RepID=A0A0A8XRL4_ARUDO